MPSPALIDWQLGRSRVLDELLDAHQAVGGPGPGRRWTTEQINWALIVRLAAEFQGFCRDLHDLGVDTFCAWAAPTNNRLQGILRVHVTRDRYLDRGNATP